MCKLLNDNNDRKVNIGKSKFIFFILLFYSILLILVTVDLIQLVNKSIDILKFFYENNLHIYFRNYHGFQY